MTTAMFKQKTKRSLLLVTTAALLTGATGCAKNEGFSDLRQYISEVKSRPKQTIPPLPVFKVAEPYIFNPDGLRDPFIEITRNEEIESIEIVANGGVRPDLTRHREEMESFSLDSLRMVGTVFMKAGLWGLIKASDGTIHRIQVGNYMGQNHGKVIRILDDRIEMMEIVPDRPGAWREQQASLVLEG